MLKERLKERLQSAREAESSFGSAGSAWRRPPSSPIHSRDAISASCSCPSSSSRKGTQAAIAGIGQKHHAREDVPRCRVRIA